MADRVGGIEQTLGRAAQLAGRGGARAALPEPDDVAHRRRWARLVGLGATTAAAEAACASAADTDDLERRLRHHQMEQLRT